MLIDFTVENFRSIKDPVTLSMVAAPGKKTTSKTSKRPRVKPDDEIAPPFRDEARNLSLLPVIAIFGANASGKSNVLQALDSLIAFIQAREALEKSFSDLSLPFGLSSIHKKAPTRFVLRVIQGATVFTYTLALNQTRILQEKLEYIPPPSRLMRSRLLFERIWHEEQEKYVIANGKDFGNAYKEIQMSLNQEESFMSLVATRLDIKICEPFVNWLVFTWPGMSLGIEKAEYIAAAGLLKEDTPEMLESVLQIVRSFDTGIMGVEIEKLEAEQPPANNPFKVWVLHNADDKQVRWPMEEESIGTQRLFSLTFKMLLMFRVGGVIIIDELGSNIHPNITRAMVRMFQSEKTNPKRAQLIFTSHDNTLQRGNLLRRDQIWFTQKRADGSTELYPLSDFSPRNDLAIDKAYLEGRFGAVPILPDEEELLEPAEAK